MHSHLLSEWEMPFPGVGGSFQRTALSVLAARWYLRGMVSSSLGQFPLGSPASTP